MVNIIDIALTIGAFHASVVIKTYSKSSLVLSCTQKQNQLENYSPTAVSNIMLL
jgi:hypothetical protein